MKEGGIEYRWKPPVPLGGWKTRSSGIVPYRKNAKGKEVKAGAAVVRIVVHSGFQETWDRAQEIADVLVKGLNRGARYLGPKTVDTIAHMETNVKSWLRPAKIVSTLREELARGSDE